MTKFLLVLVLVITIPRWAMTLAQVDTFAVAGIPVTAIGEGIVLELACWFLISAHGNAHEETQRYKAGWEAHQARMEEQGKQNRKPRVDPELSGYGQLMALYYVLLGLTIVSQWPFLMSALSGTPVTDLLGYYPQWGYTLFLVIAPEVVTFALARAHHYGRICGRRRQEREASGQDVQEERSIWTFVNAQVDYLVQLRSKLNGEYVQPEPLPSTPEPVVNHKRPGRPTLDWWRETYGQLNGERAQMTAERVFELVQAEWEQSISRTTAYNWRDECVRSLEKMEAQ